MIVCAIVFLYGTSAQAEAGRERRRPRGRDVALDERIAAGEAALAAGDSKTAVRHFSAVLVWRPDSVPALRGECEAMSRSGAYARAAELCRAAYRLEPSSEHATKLADVLLESRSPAAKAEAVSLLDAAVQGPGATPLAYELLFRLAQQRSVDTDAAKRERIDAMREAQHGYARVQSDPSAVAKQGVQLGVALIDGGRDQDRPEARGLAMAAARDARADFDALASACRIAVALDDRALLDDAGAQLERIAPTHCLSYVFAGSRAMFRKDWGAARIAFDKARAAGWAQGPYDRAMAALTSHEAGAGAPSTRAAGEPVLDVLVRRAVLLVALWFGCMVAFLLAASVLSFVTTRAAQRAATADGGTKQPTSFANTLLRRTYAAALFAVCIFYYVSLPLLLLCLLTATALFFWLAFEARRFPIKLLVVVGVAAFVTVRALVKSVFVRATEGEPGAPLDLARQPRLRALLDEVATRVGTRPIDAVYVTPGTDLAAFERGGFMSQLGRGSERCLLIGLGVLDGLKLSEFRAVLAHEYGHFSHRDTAGGGMVLAVRRSLSAMAVHLVHGGAAAWYNPAWWFFHGFHRVFLRVSQGASRLQEVLADRFAVLNYGSDPFVHGLVHVIERAIVFDAQASVALRPQLERRPPIDNLYTLLSAAPVSHESMVQAVREAIDRKPSAYDSHPAPRDRITWARKLDAPTPLAEADPDAWSVFDAREQLEAHMTERVNRKLGLLPA